MTEQPRAADHEGSEPYVRAGGTPVIAVDAHGVTLRGRRGSTNEDRFLIASIRKQVEVEGTSERRLMGRQIDGGILARVLVVADGVGGHAAGEEASRLAVHSLLEYVGTTMSCFVGTTPLDEPRLFEALQRGIHRAHAAVLSGSVRDPSRLGMASTVTLAHILWPHAYVVQVGDSRAYLLRDGVLTQVTTDQTIAQRLVDDGELEPEEAAQSRWRHVLSSALGTEPLPTATGLPLMEADTLLLCTDGLSGAVADSDISDHLARAPTAEAACHALVETALNNGATDDITVVVGRFHDSQPM